MALEEDSELIRKCIEGDGEAWRRFVQRYAPPIAWSIRRFLAGRPGELVRGIAVEDLLQDCFLILCRDRFKVLRRFDGRSSLASYLQMIAVHRASSRLDEQARFLRSTRPEERIPEEFSSEDPLRQLTAAEQQERFREALAKLSPRERLILNWVRGEGLSYEEVGDLLNLAPNSIGPLLGRAQARLLRILRKPPCGE